jgi:ribonuclease-3
MEQTTLQPKSSRIQSTIMSADVMRFMDSTDAPALIPLQRFVLNSAPIQNLQNFFDHQFNDQQLLFEATIHTSFAHEFSPLGVTSNERMEFLGDSILGAIVSTLLWEKYPALQEGELSRLRASLVNEESLAKLARAVKLQNCLLLGKGEILSGGIEKNAIVSDAFEAVLGAIFLDGGFQAAYSSFQFLSVVYCEAYGEEFFSLKKLEEFDAKSRLQEKTMELYKSLPVYKAEQLENQNFVVELFIADQAILKTENISKKKAERELAYKAIKNDLYLNTKGEPLC